MAETLKQVGLTATFSVPTHRVAGFENKQKYQKSTYVPPHQRNKPTVVKTTAKIAFENKFNGGKKQNDYSQTYKPPGLTFVKCIDFFYFLNQWEWDIFNLYYGV